MKNNKKDLLVGLAFISIIFLLFGVPTVHASMLEMDISERNPIINNDGDIVKRGYISGYLTNNNGNEEHNVTVSLSIDRDDVSFVNIEDSENLKELFENRAVFVFDKVESGTTVDWKIGLHVLNPDEREFRYSITVLNSDRERIYSSSDIMVMIKKSKDTPMDNSDNDLLTDEEETILGTDAKVKDSDNDGKIDGLDLDNAADLSLLDPSFGMWCDDPSIAVRDEARVELSVSNPITKPEITAQISLKIPSGITVHSQNVEASGGGEYISYYNLPYEKIQSGYKRGFSVDIMPVNAGTYEIEGTLLYYYADDSSDVHTESIPLTLEVTEEKDSTLPIPIPGFGILLSAVSILLALLIIYSKKT